MPNKNINSDENVNTIKSWIGHIVVVLGVIYLVSIPSGLIKKKFEPVDVGVLMALLVANSDIVQRLTQLKIGKDGLELSVEAKEKLKAEFTEDVNKQIREREDEASQLLRSVDLQLSETTALEIPLEKLKEQIRNAPPVIVEYIYYRAKEVRHNAWLCKQNKKPKIGLMERTIPIFEALTESSDGGRRHRFFAQLGYALKDQDFSDRQKAKEGLEKAKGSLENAIKIWETDHPGVPPSPHYCFNWIICVAELVSNNFQKVDSETKDKILKRIKAAASCESLRRVLKENLALQDWLKQEGLESALAASNRSCRKEHYEEDSIAA